MTSVGGGGLGGEGGGGGAERREEWRDGTGGKASDVSGS